MKKTVVCFVIAMLLWQKGEAAGFTISGTKVLDANKKEFVMRGINHSHTWFESQLNTSISGIADTKANCVRVVLSNGKQSENWGKNSAGDVKNVIDLCKKHSMIPILEVHDCTGYSEKQGSAPLSTAVDYWIELKDILIGQEEFVIINIANEPFGNNQSVSTWANEHKTAIKRLRDKGFEHLLMVDAAGWGQGASSVHNEAKGIFNSDPMKNTMFAIHMYEYAGGNASTIRNNIDKVINQNLCLCIGEFGFKHTSGDVDEQYILDYCQQKGVGWIAWSWFGNSGGVEYLDLARDASGSRLSDWGNTIVNGRNGLKETSETCSVLIGWEPEKSVADATVTIVADTNHTATYSVEVTEIPEGATYDIQWYQSDTESGTPRKIEAATKETFTASENNYQKYIFCEITGTGSTIGSNMSEPELVDLTGVKKAFDRMQSMRQYSMIVKRTTYGISVILNNSSDKTECNKAVVSVFGINGALVYKGTPAAVSGNSMTFSAHNNSINISNGLFLIVARIPERNDGVTVITEKIILSPIR